MQWLCKCKCEWLCKWGAPDAAQIRNAKPGILSEELRTALGMGDNTPPPWLINMQRYGPPPSYPDLKVPALLPAHHWRLW